MPNTKPFPPLALQLGVFVIAIILFTLLIKVDGELSWTMAVGHTVLYWSMLGGFLLWARRLSNNN
ncbi:MAG: hypothetical protein A2664_03530 [Candidatus Taylorbacteria bacterium RIFCSPHIGHO2_01_FULL_46_22b]|uniref:Uncharacterized protein n=1 Tax=Candidatus Taylorbacteria bacterium RIFCSPHIGHO2_01_FULL_46_22b TaxID=1802301 RepID=A0A1G2M1H6_9BACT|nr:MAG: hypothetical protein A2664_03530 [Candidatus Taylorbacteria bacterium RIFCSPHIGHO2_01_FULL_46_22b]